MVFAKEALNGIPLLEILFHAYIVSLLVVFCHFNHDYLDKFKIHALWAILSLHFNCRFLLRRSKSAPLYWTSEIKARYYTTDAMGEWCTTNGLMVQMVWPIEVWLTLWNVVVLVIIRSMSLVTTLQIIDNRKQNGVYRLFWGFLNKSSDCTSLCAKFSYHACELNILQL